MIDYASVHWIPSYLQETANVMLNISSDVSASHQQYTVCYSQRTTLWAPVLTSVYSLAVSIFWVHWLSSSFD